MATSDSAPYPPPEEAIEVLLDNPLRQGIMKQLTHKPGLNKHQLSKALVIHINALEFHLNRLVPAGLVVAKRGLRGDIVCFTRDNAHLWDTKSTRLLYGRSSQRQAAIFLVDNPGTSSDRLSEALGVTIATARGYMRELEKSSLVHRMRIGHRVTYYPRTPLTEWAQEVGEGWLRKRGQGSRI